MRYLIILIFNFIFYQGFAQSILQGRATDLAGEKIKLVTYDDFITYKTTTLNETRADSLGYFSFKIDINKTQFYLLESRVNSGLYIEPNKNYNITIPVVDTTLNYSNEPIYVNPEFENNSLENINVLITLFNTEYDDFIANNLNLFIQKNANQKVDSFAINITNKYAKVDKPYFTNYLTYSLANLKSASAYSSKKKIYKNYIDTLPVCYANDGYMAFINEFYDSHFKTLNFALQEELATAVKLKMRREVLDTILQKDDYLKNDTIRELIMLKGLMENYRNPTFSKKGVLMVIGQIREESKIVEHQKIAANIYAKLSSVEVGSYAPEFELFDLSENLKSLTELSNHKYVYLDFWATWCAPCVKEMKLTPALYEEFGDYIEFVSISIDKKPKTVERFVARNNYKWIFLMLGENTELLEAYKANVIPMYYLISPGGTIISSPADRPSDIRDEFQSIRDSYIKSRN